MQKQIFPLCLLVLLTITVPVLFAQNPFVQNQYTADPSARVFGDKIYVYPSHDILATPGHGRANWFNMEDYHVFSSANLTDWTDHGAIVSQDKVPWVAPASYSMWAPDCIYKNGKYYFYFPAPLKDTGGKRGGFTVGVAIADKPEGPFVPQPESIKGVQGIDPNVFTDKDGQSYLYWAQGNVYAAKLKDNMLELASEPKTLTDFPAKGLKEGPYLFERGGKYYLTYPHVENKTERLEYAIGDNPMGPFKFTGVIMDESPTGCWTNHQSIVQFKSQWYLFYHHNDLSPQFDKARSIRIDSLFFNPDGTIQKVIPTLRGVGITKATQPVQMDRYSQISPTGASIAFIDTGNTFKGWKTILKNKDAWVQYNSVDFGSKKLKAVRIRSASETGGTLQIRLNSVEGPILAAANISKGNDWQIINAPLAAFQPGVHNLFVVLKDNAKVEMDWISFE